ncbi:MAG: glycoside hydrolase family 57 protein [Candidatus Solibacter sp.]
MPQINLCFLWHMHQPFYKDLASGEYKLPWTRMHALKDYYGMVRILEEFPLVKQTFNLVPSMMAQVEEYASGEARDPFLDLALKPAESLTAEERHHLLQHSFYSDPGHMIYRYPRYGELFDARNAQVTSGARDMFSPQELRDVQMWSQLAWFDEEFQEHDPEVRAWIEKGRNFTLDDQRRMGEKQREIIGQVLPAYRRLAECGQVEISTTPFYHPILPLLCDSNIAAVAHHNVPLPPRFRYPDDARRQLQMARDYVEQHFGVAPVGLWPSEGSVSDEVFALASELGFEWAATDSGVLDRTRQQAVGVEGLYRPYEWRQNGRTMRLIFRDHFMSDLIGFVYSKMDAAQAASDFIDRMRQNCAGILASGRDALVPIILDGENAWEYYHRNGRPFLRELYRRISEEHGMCAVTASEAFRMMAPEPLDHIFPGSWINANFDIWIGAEEDNQAWTQLLRARATYDATSGVPEERRRLAYEELLIAEGSDWCWWYGPEHHTDNALEFDQLYRSHLANVYRFLNLAPPEELSRPILRIATPDVRVAPTGAISPRIDGEVSSYFEWLGAGQYRVDERSGSMHGKKFLIQEVFFGSDGDHLFVRVDFRPGTEPVVAGMEARIVVQSLDRAPAQHVTIRLAAGAAFTSDDIQCAFLRILELRFPLVAAQANDGRGLRFQLSLWQGGLPVDAVPQQGWIEMATTSPAEMAG